MSTEKIIRCIAKNVLAAEKDFNSYTPASGEKIRIFLFNASSPASTANARVKLIWDYEGAGEEILWVIQNDNLMPDYLYFDRTGDGTKKLAIVLHNSCTNDYDMSGSFMVEKI